MKVLKYMLVCIKGLLFDVVSSEVRSGLPSELLYADDFDLMAPTMDKLGRRVAEWRAILLDKGVEGECRKV